MPRYYGLSDQIQSQQGSEEFDTCYQSNQKKTRAIRAKSHEYAEEVFMCMNMESSRSSGNSKKSSLDGLTSNDEAIYSDACCAQSNNGHIYIEVGRLKGRPVKVLRDTGCTGMIVDRALIPDSMLIPGSSGSLQMVDHILIGQSLPGFPVLQRTK